MRTIYEVIQTLKEITPKTAPLFSLTYLDFCNSLDKIENSCHYTAPEAMGIRWVEISELLGRTLGPCDCAYKVNVSLYFSDKRKKEEAIEIFKYHINV